MVSRWSEALLCKPIFSTRGCEYQYPARRAAWNALASPALRFDPYPYGLLTFIVSLEGVLIATFVLTKQNRMAAQSDQRDHLNLQVDLLAEQELTVILRCRRTHLSRH
jgi:Protein of unknown function (DUF1003)